MLNQRVILLPAACLSALLASGCAIGPDYASPQPPEHAAAHFLSTGNVAAVAPLPDAWWRLYDDPNLDALVQRAFAANTDLRVAEANLEHERAVLSEVGNARFPSTELSASKFYGNNTSPSGQGLPTPNKQWTSTGAVVASWEIDLLGRVRRSVEAERDNVEAVQAARDAVRVKVAADTTRNYVEACALAESVTTAHASIDIARQTLGLTQQQVHAGAASPFDAERAAATLAATEASLPPLEAQRQNALFALAALAGSAPSDVPEAAAACTHAPKLAGPIPVDDGAALLKRRPDVREAERKLAADTARIGVAMGDLYPRIYVNGAINYLRDGSSSASGGPGTPAWTFGVGPALTWSFPNIGVARARVKQAKAQTQASLATFDGTVLNALRDVEQALTSLGAQERRYVSLAQADERTSNAYRLANDRYRAGNISQLELLDASRDRVAAQAALADSAVSLNAARVDLFNALGGGW
ncbi:efflux transporter outer membrane subunit [Trinickia fusca]|uniref:Efflux transporter outer membrane subunit n=1 Tax=Trinickia fusca TaxID=2419777 RepID=A0A494XAJ4_9BURK|nr:efflux transporter outer membrane subunit [Trinickia fusca]RKP47520.1 efflux transporter outer membrane subunit [Trinickia fusca]